MFGLEMLLKKEKKKKLRIQIMREKEEGRRTYL